MPDDFDPRLAALQYAASVEAHGREGGIEPAAGDALHALVCGLLYVGDEIRRVRGGDVSPSGRRTQVVADLLWQFDPEGTNKELRRWASDLLRGEGGDGGSGN